MKPLKQVKRNDQEGNTASANKKSSLVEFSKQRLLLEIPEQPPPPEIPKLLNDFDRWNELCSTLASDVEIHGEEDAVCTPEEIRCIKKDLMQLVKRKTKKRFFFF